MRPDDAALGTPAGAPQGAGKRFLLVPLLLLLVLLAASIGKSERAERGGAARRGAEAERPAAQAPRCSYTEGEPGAHALLSGPQGPSVRRVDSAELCCAACGADELCGAFTFIAAWSLCLLGSAPPRRGGGAELPGTVVSRGGPPRERAALPSAAATAAPAPPPAPSGPAACTGDGPCSSPPDARQIAEIVWRGCLQSPFAAAEPRATPAAVRETHRKLLEATQDLREKTQPHMHVGFRGPWIENVFVSHFARLSPGALAPWVPILVPWTDMCAPRPIDMDCHGFALTRKIVEPLMRADMLFFTTVQHLQGLGVGMMRRHPNLFVFAAGGYGHVPIPLLLPVPLDPLPPPPADAVAAVFPGQYATHAIRRTMGEVLKAKLGDGYRHYYGSKPLQEPNGTWVQIVRGARFVLAPRGLGRTSFRLYEGILLGRLPVYVHDGIPWLPYRMDWGSVGIIAGPEELGDIPRRMAAFTPARYEAGRRELLRLRDSHFSMQGVVRHIAEYLDRPGAANLSCQQLPPNTQGAPGENESAINVLRAERPSRGGGRKRKR